MIPLNNHEKDLYDQAEEMATRIAWDSPRVADTIRVLLGIIETQARDYDLLKESCEICFQCKEAIPSGFSMCWECAAEKDVKYESEMDALRAEFNKWLKIHEDTLKKFPKRESPGFVKPRCYKLRKDGFGGYMPCANDLPCNMPGH